MIFNSNLTDDADQTPPDIHMLLAATGYLMTCSASPRRNQYTFGFFSMTCIRHALVLLLVLLSSCSWRDAESPEAFTKSYSDFGILLMAHGGSPEWNGEVLAAVDLLQDQYPIEVAFGMANAATIQEAVRMLETQGIRRIGVIRLFISGESWYQRTEKILGLRAGAPPRPEPVSHAGGVGYGSDNHSMAFWRIQTESAFKLTTQGLAEAEGMGIVLADRARALSDNPRWEDILILAHGPEDDSENERWIAHIDARAEAVRNILPFRHLQVMTLREDWAEKREPAKHRIRTFVERAHDDGVTTIVIPFRVHGFGPYAEVLDGLDYVADGRGLLPHLEVTKWIEEQAETLRQGAFRSVADGLVADIEPMRVLTLPRTAISPCPNRSQITGELK